MAPIPSSDLPGHRRLHQRALSALGVCQETQNVEFKESGTWADLRWRITNATLGMGNLRDGGLMIIGVSERDAKWTLTGISEDDLETYKTDKIISHINAYVSPFVELDVVLLDHDSKQFLVIGVREFRDTPLVCCKNGPLNSRITQGRVYIRPPGVARTTVITDATQMHDLLELAAEKRARRILETSRRIGLSEKEVEAASQLYDREIKGL